ncbi:MAG: ATP-binding cassette domain-containing protein [Eubacteriales bacterium]|nr:ATP-binding cassette domain-containing protein [Eubacteriales bacterium]
MNIKIENLTKIYGERTVLDIEDLLIEEGSLYGIIGPNGAGKSTLLNIIAGLDKQTEGRILYGKSKEEIIPRRDITMVFQRPYLMHTTTEKNISYPLKLRGWKEKEIRERVNKLTEDLGLTSLKKQRSWTLSAGETQKVALARALSFHPKLLLLDEPTANIDPATTGELERMLKTINKTEGTTILIITHNLAQAKRLCEKAIFLHNGKVVEAGDSDLLLKTPRNPLTQRFICGELLI